VNLEEGSYVIVDNLQSFEGTQYYPLSESVAIEDYGSIVIWCQEFNVTFGRR
jgi:hypothetical protein